MSSERGQTSVEWLGLLLLVSSALGAAGSVAPLVDGRSFGTALAHAIVCAARGGCDDGDRALRRTYGPRDAALVRDQAPNVVYEPGTLTLPVDYRRCRSHRCSDAPDDRDLDVHRSLRGGQPATAFTHVVRRRGETFIQYWLYYPDSTSTVANAAGIWNSATRPLGWAGLARPAYPGFHRDDWESYQVRIGRGGRTWVRASAHRGYQGCKQRRCSNRWISGTGWTRVSRGSHAGHIPLRARRTGTSFHHDFPFVRGRYSHRPVHPGNGLRERSTSAAGLRLVPLERIDPRGYRALDAGVVPPWRKEVYREPLSDRTS